MFADDRTVEGEGEEGERGGEGEEEGERRGELLGSQAEVKRRRERIEREEFIKKCRTVCLSGLMFHHLHS